MVGNAGPIHVGNHLRNAADSLSLPVQFCDIEAAFEAPRLVARVNWWLRGHRPTRLREFSKRVLQAAIECRANCVIATGLAPLDAKGLKDIGASGTLRVNYLTDDPWNPRHRAGWFLDALPKYDCVFSTRKSNIEDLIRLGCAKVRYLPFAYAPEAHYSDPPVTAEEDRRYSADVMFAGGADEDRVPYVIAFIRAGFQVALYGGYWGRYRETKLHDRGHASASVLRKAIGGGRIALCLVRRANRDGHAMRTYELAATGACILAEDTEEHREILGPEGVAAKYFSSIDEMLAKASALLRNSGERRRLAMNAQQRIYSGSNAYKDRLVEMLGTVNEGVAV